MKIRKFLSFVAFAALVATSLVACNKNNEIDDELDAKESKKVAFVKQEVAVALSQDLRAIADITISARGVDGEDIFMDGAKYSDKDTFSSSPAISTLTFPCELSVSLSCKKKADFVPEIGKKYVLDRSFKVSVSLLNSKEKTLATKSNEYSKPLTVVAKEDTDWDTIFATLEQKVTRSITVEKDADGAFELED